MGGAIWATGLDISLAAAFLVGLGRVLRRPCLGRFMWPFDVAGLGLRYLMISVSVMLGHPFRNPLRTAFRRVEIFGLHSDWCANLTALAHVRTEYAKVAALMCGRPVVPLSGTASGAWCGARSIQGPGRGRTAISFAVRPKLGMGSVHKSVLGSLCPRKITLPLYTTSHL